MRHISFFPTVLLTVSSLSLAETLPSSGHTENTPIHFDISALKSLGYGPEVADFFKQGGQFLPGQYEVTFRVNNSAQYVSTAQIGEQGQLCVDNALQHTLKLKTVPLSSVCPTLDTLYPGTKVTPHPNDFVIDVLVPESAFDPLVSEDELTRGGFAILNNYRLYGMQIKGGDTQQFYQGQFETGANWQNWVLRNQSSLSSGKNHTQYQLNETTLSRAIEPWAAQLQMGQINTQGQLFGGTPLLGAQLYSDASSQQGSRLVVPVIGIAEGPSTVEVNQNGRLLYRTIVPAGPFQLERLNRVVSGQPLDVTVTQDTGAQQHFTVTTAVAESGSASVADYQFALGRYRERHRMDEMDTPLIASAEGRMHMAGTDYAAGALLSQPYQSIGGRVSTQWESDFPIRVGMGVTASHHQGEQGLQADVNASQSINSLSIGLSSLYRTREYPTLEVALQRKSAVQPEPEAWGWDNGETHIATSATLGWSFQDWGRVGYSLSYNQYYGRKASETTQMINYGNKWGPVTARLSYQTTTDRDDRILLSASMPFGQKAGISMQMQQYGDDKTLSSIFNHRPSDLWGYSLGLSHSRSQDRVNAGLNMTTAYSLVNANGSWGEDDSRSMMVSASGAVAYADGVLATSPVALGDTFGVLRVPGQSGVRVSAMGGGSTVTNHFGTAAIPTLPTQRKTTVQLDTKDLPLNVRLDTTSFDVAVARGTVITRNIHATVMKQLLLGVTMKNGAKAPSGASVLNAEGQLVGVVMSDGQVMLINDQIGQPIMLRVPNQSDCVVSYPVPEHFDPNALYEEASAVCQ